VHPIPRLEWMHLTQTNNKTASQGGAVLSGILHIVGNIICEEG